MMTEVGAAIEEIRTELDASAIEFSADLCDIVLLTSGQDDSGGHGDTTSTVASDIPCSVEALAQPVTRVVGGRVLTGLDHQITLPSNANTRAILPKHKIVVDPRGNTPALTFNDPVILEDSLGPFVVVHASLGVG